MIWYKARGRLVESGLYDLVQGKGQACRGQS